MTQHFPVLIADIGGTFTRLAILESQGSQPRLIAKFKTADYPDPQSAFLAALNQQEIVLKPKSALLAVAAPIGKQTVHLTNAAWWIDPEKIGTALSLSKVVLINDFPPIAALLPQLETTNPDHVARLGPDCAGDEGPMLVLGPGTGLGAALLRTVKDLALIEPTEAGHIEFGASSEEELALWPLIERHDNRHTAESILCGAGIARLYDALALQRGQKKLKSDVASIIQSALGGETAARECLNLYAGLLGRFAGDLALVFGATGGVYLAGGIAPRIYPLLQKSAFRTSFENKAPFGSLLKSIPTFVITRPDPALYGLAELASYPDRYWLNSQIWEV
jgi:glucokinase